MLEVNKPYLPNKERYFNYIERIYESGWVTNEGPLKKELEHKLAKYLEVKNVVLVANGTLALQVAIRAMGLSGEVVTTPFSFFASSSSLAWQGLTPRFSDIDGSSLNIDASKIGESVTDKVSALLPVHVFGNPCNVEMIADIANYFKLKVIYDASHAFGVKYKEKNVLSYGDVSTVSFHATKLFHTIEGGAVITEDDALADRVRKIINFGFSSPYNHEELGINAKMNEFEAAMGLCVLEEIDNIFSERKRLSLYYKSRLNDVVSFQNKSEFSNENYSYMPVIFDSERSRVLVEEKLVSNNIAPRRYFYPSLDSIEVLRGVGFCPVSRDISSRVLCLPFFVGLTQSDQDRVIDTILGAL